MKIACQANLVPGEAMAEKLDRLEKYGFEGVELRGTNLLETEKEAEKAIRGRKIRVSTICAGYRGCALDSSKEERDLAMGDMKKLLDAGARLGAVGLIFVPIFGPPRIPDLSPLMTDQELEKKLLVELCRQLGDYAEKAGCLLLLEPLNRYETHLLNRLEQAVEICEEVNSPGVKIMADFFHMSIEEKDIARSIEGAGHHIRHIHLADSNRLLPGHGHTDFASGFAALKKIGYSDFMALECGIPGSAEKELPKAVSYLKSLLPSVTA